MRRIVLTVFLAAATSAFADDGKGLYDTKCAMCHGKDGVAKPPGKGSRDFNDPAYQAASSVDDIVSITANGKGKMPAYRSKLTPEQIRAIAAYVKTFGTPR
jgi:mono/diheme cytochrome c family protein